MGSRVEEEELIESFEEYTEFTLGDCDSHSAIPSLRGDLIPRRSARSFSFFCWRFCCALSIPRPDERALISSVVIDCFAPTLKGMPTGVAGGRGINGPLGTGGITAGSGEGGRGGKGTK